MAEEFFNTERTQGKLMPDNKYFLLVPKTFAVESKKQWPSQFSGKKLYTMIGVVILIIAAIVFSLVFLQPHDIKLVGLWVASFVFFFGMRLPDSWKMGLEVFFLFTFIYAYAFGLMFILPLIYCAFYLVTRIRPDEVNGVVVHIVVLTGLAFTARLFYGWYGMAITPGQFVLAALLGIFIWLVVDTIIAIKTAPVPLPKLMITHGLQIIISYYTATFFGFKVLQFFLHF